MRRPTGFYHSSLVFAGVKSVENKAMQRKKLKSLRLKTFKYPAKSKNLPKK